MGASSAENQEVSRSQIDIVDTNEYQEETAEVEVKNEHQWSFADYKFAPYEEKFFSFVSSIYSNQCLDFRLFALLNCLADFQLFNFSWRGEVFASNDFWVIQFIFNPLYYVVQVKDAVMLAIAMITIAILSGALIYIIRGYKTGKFKSVWPVYVFRFLSHCFSSALLIPYLQAFIFPTKCTDNDVVFGYEASCQTAEHLAILVLSAISALFLVVYTSLSDLLTYEFNPKSRIGKVNGLFDVFYIFARIALVIIQHFLTEKIAAIINFIILGVTMLFFFQQQPHYESTLNNLRFGFISAAWLVSLCSIVGFFINLSSVNGFVPYSAVVLALTALLIPAGCYANSVLVSAICKRTYNKLKIYLTGDSDAPLSEVEFRKSQLSLLYENIDGIVLTKAMDERTNFYPFANWAEITIRFIRKSYLSNNAVNLASGMFDSSFGEYPRASQLHISYVLYMDQYFPELRKTKTKHYQILAKKCNLTFANRYQLYLFQRKAGRMSTTGDEEDETINYEAMLEYQANENIVRKYHVDSLKEIRDFWQMIRDGRSDYELNEQLKEIGKLADRTNNLYSSLASRYSESQNMLNLQARFIAMVYADFDTAKTISSAAEEIEIKQQKVELLKQQSESDDNEVHSDISGEDTHSAALKKQPGDVEKKSMGSSNSSGREAKIRRQKRLLLGERLDTPFKVLLRNSSLFITVCVIVVVVSVILGHTILSSTNEGLTFFLTNTGRSAVQTMSLNARKLVNAAVKNDSAAFASVKAGLKRNYDQWHTEVFNLYQTGSALEPSLPLKFLYEGKYTVRVLSGQDFVQTVSSFCQELMNFQMNEITSKTVGYNKMAVRFFFDNSVILNEYQCKRREDEITEYATQITQKANIMYGLFSALLVVIVLYGYIYSFINLRKYREHHFKVIQLLMKVTGKPILNMLTALEEEIENVSSEEQLGGSSKRASAANVSKWRFVLPWKYLVSLSIAMAGIAYLLTATNEHISATVNYPIAFDRSGYRKSLAYRLQRLTYELVENETITRQPGEVYAETQLAMVTVRQINADSAEKFKYLLPPYQPPGELYQSLRTGRCFELNQSTCDFPSLYFPEYGYSKELAFAGVDIKIDRFLDELSRFLTLPVYTSTSSTYKLIEKLSAVLSPHINYMIEDVIKFDSEKAADLQRVLIGVGAGVVGLFMIVYYTGFWAVCAEYKLSNKTLISILYSIPASDRARLHEINNFVESAGANMN